MKPERFSKLIKNRAEQLGFQKIGITAAKTTPVQKNNLETWLKDGFHAEMGWMEKRSDERGDIFSYFPDAKTIISVGMNYYTDINKEINNSSLNFSNYAWGDDYHALLKTRLFELLSFIQSHKTEVNGLVCVDTSPVMEKVWAQEAGLGWQGKHTNLISKDYGSWLFLGEVILDIELNYDPPFEEDLCGSCTACIDACPTMALDEYVLDSQKCISYLTIEHRGPFPVEYQDQLHGWMYGCDICQEVCPWNQKFQKNSNEPAFQPRWEIIHWSKNKWERLEKEGFRELFKDSAVKRTKFEGLKRNVFANNHNR